MRQQLPALDGAATTLAGRHHAPPIFRMRALVTAALVTSGLIHVALTPEHLQEAPLLGLGFLVVAALQLGLAFVFARRPAPRLWPAAVILTSFSIAVYIVARTAGLPLAGEHAHEPVAALDMICKGAELLAAVGLLASVHTTTHEWPAGRSLRMAPYNRYAYLLALMLAGVVGALYLAHSGSHVASSR